MRTYSHSVHRSPAMGTDTVHLPPELWDRIFDLLPFKHQLEKATVCHAWNNRVARWATLRLSCPTTRIEEHYSIVSKSLRNYRSFSAETIRTEEDYQCVQKVLQECQRKFCVQRFRFWYVTGAIFERFLREHFEWFRSARCLVVNLCEEEPFPVDVLRELTGLRELRLLNLSDVTVDWSAIAIRSEHITKLTIDAAWYFNDEALEQLVEAICRCRNLTELTLRSNDTTSLGMLAESLGRLEKLTLMGLHIRLVEDSLHFPSLIYFNFDIDWFVFEKPYLVIKSPRLQTLLICKRTIPFVKFPDSSQLSRLHLYGYSLSMAHPCFTTVKDLTLTTCEPANREAIMEEIQLFPSIEYLSVKLRCKSCTIVVPEAATFQHVVRLHLNNFVLSMEFFADIARMKLLEHLSVEECNFSLDPSDEVPLLLPHLSYFNVKRVSMPMTVDSFPIIGNEDQPPVVIVDKLRTHLWRSDNFNHVFSSRRD
ncbi:uncharacterized protein LOC5573957 isoform X1 [Aedes aegypti]|uniref:Uncharacterized protein n=1 Tax=Aedes aegypti TaxID=7159 RepID=A0A6I8T518_AEDAE|nr:uncharacterized protein LOC5573957 isoform X1 [Aedes aegypti]